MPQVQYSRNCTQPLSYKAVLDRDHDRDVLGTGK